MPHQGRLTWFTHLASRDSCASLGFLAPVSVFSDTRVLDLGLWVLSVNTADCGAADGI